MKQSSGDHKKNEHQNEGKVATTAAVAAAIWQGRRVRARYDKISQEKLSLPSSGNATTIAHDDRTAGKEAAYSRFLQAQLCAGDSWFVSQPMALGGAAVANHTNYQPAHGRPRATVKGVSCCRRRLGRGRQVRPARLCLAEAWAKGRTQEAV